MTQQIIPSKVIQIAKALQQAQIESKQLVIIQKRQTGRKLAIKLAKGEQILPVDITNPSSN